VGRIGLRWGCFLSAVLIVRTLVDVLKPLTDGVAILSQHDTGRGFLLGISIPLIFMTAGFMARGEPAECVWASSSPWRPVRWDP
jgi:hypothetical protein